MSDYKIMEYNPLTDTYKHHELGKDYEDRCMFVIDALVKSGASEELIRIVPKMISISKERYNLMTKKLNPKEFYDESLL